MKNKDQHSQNICIKIKKKICSNENLKYSHSGENFTVNT